MTSRSSSRPRARHRASKLSARLAFVALGAGSAGLASAGCADDAPTNGMATSGDAGATTISTPDATVPPTADAAADAATMTAIDGGAIEAGTPRVPVKAETTSTRVTTSELLFASGEMQISGEPFASTFAGRNLAYYDRTYLPPNMYLEGIGTENETPLQDLFGFATAVESYEYSKYHMNMVAQESSAGVSLANGPVVQKYNTGAKPSNQLINYSYQLLTAVGSDVSGNSTLPAPVGNPLNILGFQGLWPNMAPFRTFDPSMKPSINVVSTCNFQGGYGGIPSVNSLTPQYECAYNSTHLTDRESQVEKVISPLTMGLATWKEAIWGIDFVGRIHDTANNQINAVAPGDMAKVGTQGNLVVGIDPPGASSGTFIGSSPIEGMWGIFMLAEIDNAAELLNTKLMTEDGTTLTGFALRTDALSYDYSSKLRWYPTAVNVAEDTTSDLYPLTTGFAINDAHSQAGDLAALLLGHAMVFGMTDARNVGVGQRIGLEVTFDGAPFASDDGIADGEETLHDRSLAVIRVAFVDLDRIHADPATGVLLDTATMSATGAITRGNTVTTTTMGHELIALRQTLLSVNGSITQYGAADPDPSADLGGILNNVPLHPGGAAGDAGGPSTTFSPRVRAVFTTNANFLVSTLTKADGTVASSATLSNGTFSASFGGTSIEAQTAAARGLTEAFLVTGDTTYRDRARAVVLHLIGPAFWSDAARMFRGTENGADEIDITPETFAWLLSSLRETYKTLQLDGDTALGRPMLEDRIARVMKLYANGWDDLDGDGNVQTSSECLSGRLQNGEQALTGELGEDAVGVRTTDRDSDCVPEIDSEPYGSVMAGSVHFHSP